jgi:nascent polypeptide-associated complex subunit alpha
MELKVMQRRMNPRDAKRMMQRMGMNMDAVEDVQEVIIRTPSKEIVIEEPEVAIVNMQGQKIFQVAGGRVTERAPEHRAAGPTASEEDVSLVAAQTGKSVDAARKALIECEGDLAKAILLLQS